MSRNICRFSDLHSHYKTGDSRMWKFGGRLTAKSYRAEGGEDKDSTITFGANDHQRSRSNHFLFFLPFLFRPLNVLGYLRKNGRERENPHLIAGGLSQKIKIVTFIKWNLNVLNRKLSWKCNWILSLFVVDLCGKKCQCTFFIGCNYQYFGHFLLIETK